MVDIEAETYTIFNWNLVSWVKSGTQFQLDGKPELLKDADGVSYYSFVEDGAEVFQVGETVLTGGMADKYSFTVTIPRRSYATPDLEGGCD